MQKNWVELTSARPLGLLLQTGKKNWPIADRYVLGNNPRNNYGMHFGFQFPSLF